MTAQSPDDVKAGIAATFDAAAADYDQYDVEFFGPVGRWLVDGVAPGMVSAVRRDVAARGLAHVDVRVGDAEDPPGRVPDGDRPAVQAAMTARLDAAGSPDGGRRPELRRVVGVGP